MTMSNEREQALQQQLMNIGPTMAKKLVAVGIDSPKKLRAMGAKKAFLRIHEQGQFCGEYNAAYLYALEGAIRNVDWRAIPERLKKEYKQYTARLRAR